MNTTVNLVLHGTDYPFMQAALPVVPRVGESLVIHTNGSGEAAPKRYVVEAVTHTLTPTGPGAYAQVVTATVRDIHRKD